MIRSLAILALFALAAFLVWVRLSPNDPGKWHADPMTVEPARDRSYHLLRPADLPGVRGIGQGRAPVWDMSVAELARAIDRIALGDGETELLAGSVSAGQMTYITRSKWAGFPDFTSVRVFAVGQGASLAIYARPRFPGYDWGVNRARVERWIARLGPSR